MNKAQEQLERMKAMMTYGLKTESKKPYSSVEYTKVGADGKMYGIVREGNKFFIKVGSKDKAAIKENFDYIGGFMNHKDYEYESYAKALKNFDLKMISLKEAYGNKKILVESWNPEAKEVVKVEATEEMRKAIERQRQIMRNAKLIESREYYKMVMNEGCNKVDKDCAASQKENMKHEKSEQGKPTEADGTPFTENPDKEFVSAQKNNVKNECNPVTEGEEVLAWNDNKDYLDTSNGTEKGDGNPFNEEPNTEKEAEMGTVNEETAMHDEGENQNKPEVGVGEKGDNTPFEKEVKDELSESIEDEFADEEDDTVEDDSFEDVDAEGDDLFDGEDSEVEDDEENPVEDVELDDTEERLNKIEDMLSKIADKLGVGVFDDDSLYGDEEVEGEGEDSDSFEIEFDSEDDEPEDDDFEDEDDTVYESKDYKKVMNEENMDYFGKHPAYRKQPMSTPKNSMKDKEGYYDMNDESVENEQPYGEKLGDNTPFKVSPQEVENAITECLTNLFLKKK